MSQRTNKPGRGKRPTRRPARRNKATAAIAQRPGMMRVRRSRVHGRGVFALRRIRKGTRIIEYLGDRVSHRQADLRYEHKDISDNHTFLFIVDRNVVIDGGSNGNAARFINHSCDPNSESLIDDRRVFIEAIRTIQPGEEITYDYQIGRDRNDPPNVDEIFACRCGAGGCRGSMLWPPRRKLRATPSTRKRSVRAGNGA
jgi:SET domain-containing protein